MHNRTYLRYLEEPQTCNRVAQLSICSYAAQQSQSDMTCKTIRRVGAMRAAREQQQQLSPAAAAVAMAAAESVVPLCITPLPCYYRTVGDTR
jgi:hypothetical protein